MRASPAAVSGGGVIVVPPLGYLPTDWWTQPLAGLASLAPIERLRWPLADAHGVEVLIKREDLLNPYLGGNKFYKLYYHLRAAREQGAEQLISFGGAFSNHLYALGYIARSLKLRLIAVIRGDEKAPLSATLQDIQALGTRLHFISRSDYRAKHSIEFIGHLQALFGSSYLIPEGGGGVLGAKGVCAWAEGLSTCHWPTPLAVGADGQLPVDVVCLPSGTGASLAGVIAGAKVNRVLGVSALKLGAAVLEYQSGVQELVTELGGAMAGSWCLEDRFHSGGYGRYPMDLAAFVSEFEAQTQVPLDPVYGAKMFYAIAYKIQHEWSPGTRVLVLHTGGIQGKRGVATLKR